MKNKSILLIAIGLMAINVTNAKGLLVNAKDSGKPTFDKSTSVVQVNLGLGGGLGLPIQVSYEKAITDNIGVGGLVGFATKSTDLVGYKYRYTYLLFGARANYHYQFIEKLDTYAGLTLGYNVASFKITPSYPGSTATAGGGIFLAGQIGGRYYFTENLAASLELGYGIGYANIGIAYKLK
jgi:hypothetical protein